MKSVMNITSIELDLCGGWTPLETLTIDEDEDKIESSVIGNYPQCSHLGPINADTATRHLYIMNRCTNLLTSMAQIPCTLVFGPINQIRTYQMTVLGDTVYWATRNEHWI